LLERSHTCWPRTAEWLEVRPEPRERRLAIDGNQPGIVPEPGETAAAFGVAAGLVVCFVVPAEQDAPCRLILALLIEQLHRDTHLCCPSPLRPRHCCLPVAL